MTTFVTALRSSLGKKYLMALTGLIWVGFAIGHLTGNLLLFAGREAFNGYAYFLEELGHGMGVYIADFFLLLALAIHVWHGVEVAFLDKSAARPDRYIVQGNAGHRSRKGIASVSMVWTGLFLLGFLVLHIATFKFAHLWGPVTQMNLDGVQVKDLYGIVVERFSHLWYVAIYTIAMALFGMHLKHGVWSAFQSLGLLNKKTYPLAVTLATVLAVLLSIGFLLLPTLIFVMNPMFSSPEGGIHL
jgi:succinate dehydrogenase / fumarate reductase, cytochrome b subunit